MAGCRPPGSARRAPGSRWLGSRAAARPLDLCDDTAMTTNPPGSLRQRIEALGRAVGEREAANRPARERAAEHASTLREFMAQELDAFHRSAAAAGADHLRIELSEPRVDDKHLHAVEFELARGRYRAIVTVKSRGEVTLVGPFHAGKVEGPCRSFPLEAGDEIRAALGEFLLRFAEEAATP